MNGLSFPHQVLIDADYDLLYRNKHVELRSDLVNVFDCSQNWESETHYRNLEEKLIQLNFPFLILTSCPLYQSKFSRYYPHFALQTQQLSKKDIDFNNPRPYKFGALMHKAHAHRLWMQYHCIRHLDSCANSFNNRPGDPVELAELDWEPKQWGGQQPVASDFVKDWDLTVPSYQSYVMIETETMMRPGVFASEKTWKLMLSGQFFILLGSPGTVDYLRTLGVDVFDDIIDHGYDSSGPWQDRCLLAANEIRRLQTENLDQMWMATLARRESNRNNFLSGKWFDRYLESIINWQRTFL